MVLFTVVQCKVHHDYGKHFVLYNVVIEVDGS